LHQCGDIAKIDPEDLIFPRTASRIGPKYQATVAAVPEPYSTPPGTIPSIRAHFGTDYYHIEIEERGTDNTVEVLGIINTFTESECKA
jgi:hypothetical protein